MTEFVFLVFLAASAGIVLATTGLLVWRLRNDVKSPHDFEVVRIKGGRFAIRHSMNRHWWMRVIPAYDRNLDGSLGWGDKIYRLTYASAPDALADFALFRQGGYITGKEVRGR